MNVVTLAECYEAGWRIADLAELVLPRYEEIWSDPDPQETVRRIARSQDERSHFWTRRWLRDRLLDRDPSRAFNPQLDLILDNTINLFYFGDSVPTAISNAHARQLRARETEHNQRSETTIAEISQELVGIGYADLPDFLGTAIVPKYSEDFTPEEFESILHRAVKLAAATDPQLIASMNAALPKFNKMEALSQHFASHSSLATVVDVLDELAAKGEEPAQVDETVVMAQVLTAPKEIFRTKSGVTVHQLTIDPAGHLLRISNGAKTIEVPFKADFDAADIERVSQFTNGPANVPYLRNKLVEALA